MINAQISQLRQRMRTIEDRLRELLAVLLDREPLLKAHLRFQPRTCGHAGCKCRRGELHAAWIVQIPHEGKTRCRSVREEVYKRLEKPAEAYRRFRQARAEWNRVLGEADRILGEMEEMRLLDVEKALGSEEEAKS